MKALIHKWLGITAEREASNELIGQYRDLAAKARAELDEVRQARDAAIEALLLENTRLKDQLAKAG